MATYNINRQTWLCRLRRSNSLEQWQCYQPQ